LEAFVACFKEFAVVAKDRDSPGALHDHPLEEKERDRFIARVAEINAGSTGHDFWEAAVSC